MNRPQFDEFFQTATGNSPYGYQCRLACGDDARSEKPESLTGGCECRSQLINIPTGLGKTAAVVLAWLWNRVVSSLNPKPSSTTSSQWPHRLVYCLPMRTLVEQRRDNARLWILRLALAATEDRSTERTKIDAEIERHAASIESGKAKESWLAAVRAPWGDDECAVEGAFANVLAHARDDLVWLGTHSPVILMGGEEADWDWDVWPEKPAILIGTQDMLLSRALNRGYGLSRYRWPMHFGLLHTDCLWVFDEIQLMGCGLATTVQLEAFRGRNGCASFWMSATLRKDWLNTVDFADRLPALPLVKLEEDDLQQNRDVRERREARKPVQSATARMDDSVGLAAEILTAHQRAGGRTLVVVNTVKRARELSHQLQRITKSAESKPELVLIHSRFRPNDRRRQVASS